MRPLVVCLGERRPELLEALEGDGWLVHAGWTLPWREWDVSGARVVCEGRVAHREDAQAALLAAARGAGVVAVVEEAGRLLARFFDDLGRLGPVTLRRPGEAAGPDVRLSTEERRVLELLAAGATLAEAAGRLHLSRRTADRRLAAARRALGVRTTAEAVVALGAAAAGARLPA